MYDHFEDVFDEEQYAEIWRTAYARALHEMQRQRRLHGHPRDTGRRPLPDIQFEDLADTTGTIPLPSLSWDRHETTEEGGTE